MTCPLCAEEVPAGSTRCPHCGESFLLPPLPATAKGPLPSGVQALAWAYLLLAGLRLLSSAQLVWVLVSVSVGIPDFARILATQLVHTALVVAAGVGLLLGRSWAPIVAWLQAGLTVFSLGSYLLSFVGIGGGFRFDLFSMANLGLSLVVLVMTLIVLARPDVRAAFRAGR